MSGTHGKARTFREGRDEEYSYPLVSSEEQKNIRERELRGEEFFKANSSLRIEKDYYSPEVAILKLETPWGELVVRQYFTTLYDWSLLDDPYKYLIENFASKLATKILSKVFSCQESELHDRLKKKFKEDYSFQWKTARERSSLEIKKLLKLEEG